MTGQGLAAPTLDDIRAARERLRGVASRTPLLPLGVDGPASGGTPTRIYLKLESLQPMGSFKIRGAANALGLAPPEALERGVYTASAGNMAQGLAWSARRLGIPCTVVVPDHAPQTKLEAIRRLGGEIVPVPFERWWRVLKEHSFPSLEGHFVHPVADPAVIAGNGTVGLEIVEDLPEVDTVLVPFGGGGLSCGIAAALRALAPRARVYACEVETAAPLSPSLAEGRPVEIEYTPSFVDGIGASSVLPEMWPMARELLAGALVSALGEVADAVRLLAERNRIIAEGAGATPVAAALAGRGGSGNIVCVVSGGNLDASKLTALLAGKIP